MGKHSARRHPFTAKRVAFLSATAVVTAVVATDHRPSPEEHTATATDATGLSASREYSEPIAPPAPEQPGEELAPPVYQAGPPEPEAKHPERIPAPAVTASTRRDADVVPDDTLHRLHDVPEHNPAMAHDLDTMSRSVTSSISVAMDASDALTQRVRPGANTRTPERDRELADIAAAINKALTDLAAALQAAVAAVDPNLSR